jgi:integrase
MKRRRGGEDRGMRYVTPRTDKGGVRWYWQRRGYPLARLPDDEVARHVRARELNNWADNTPPADKPRVPAPLDLVGGIIDDYHKTPRYRELAASTQSYYDRWAEEIRAMWGERRVAAIDRKLCEDWLNSLETKSQRRLARAVLRVVMERAVYHGKLAINPTDGIELASTMPRQVFFSDDDLAAFGRGCLGHKTHGAMVYLGSMLLLFTGQRPGDMLRMTWRQYNGRTIWLRQQKTGKLVEVPAHPDLRAMLDRLRPEARDLVIMMHAGRPVSMKTFGYRFNEVKRATKLDHLQPHDFRRTAVVRMAEGGAEIQDIAAVTGHSIERTRTILETYLPRTLKMAERAVERMRGVSLTFFDQLMSNAPSGAA